MAGKRIRTDETPPLAGFRIYRPHVDGSGRAPGARASEHVAQERMEVDATLHVRQLEGSPIPVWTESSRFAVVAIDFMIPVVQKVN